MEIGWRKLKEMWEIFLLISLGKRIALSWYNVASLIRPLIPKPSCVYVRYVQPAENGRKFRNSGTIF